MKTKLIGTIISSRLLQVNRKYRNKCAFTIARIACNIALVIFALRRVT